MSRVVVPYIKGVLIGLSITGFLYILLSMMLFAAPSVATQNFAETCTANGASAEFCGCIDNQLQSNLNERQEKDLLTSNPNESYEYQAVVEAATINCSADTRLTVN